MESARKVSLTAAAGTWYRIAFPWIHRARRSQLAKIRERRERQTNPLAAAWMVVCTRATGCCSRPEIGCGPVCEQHSVRQRRMSPAPLAAPVPPPPVFRAGDAALRVQSINKNPDGGLTWTDRIDRGKSGATNIANPAWQNVARHERTVSLPITGDQGRYASRARHRWPVARRQAIAASKQSSRAGLQISLPDPSTVLSPTAPRFIKN
jgi:hypothetical protein